jgi:signal peptidase
MSPMGKTVKSIWNVFTSIILVIVVLLAIALVGVRLLGFQVLTVLSGSMEPTYRAGALIYVKKVDYKELQPGDVITFMLDEDTVATHRIVEVVPDETDPETLRYRTKGDANKAEDGGLVHYKNVIGKPVFSIPYLGYVADYIQHPPGMYVAISAGAILLLLVIIPDIVTSDEKKKKAGMGKKDTYADCRKEDHYNDEPVSAESFRRLWQNAEVLLSEEELQVFDARLMQESLTQDEYRSIYRHMKMLIEERSAQQ